MKMKVKFDLASIKGWLLQHGEKLGLGVMAVVFVLFFYSAIRRETLDGTKQPSNLTELAGNATRHVSESAWKQEVTVVDYRERAQTKPIPPDYFPAPRPFNGPVANPKSKREVPQILPIEEPRVAAGLDVFAMRKVAAAADAKADAKPSGESELKAQPWVVVTALVPYEKQRAEFDRAFAQAESYDPNRDVPMYAAPMLERATIDEANPTAPPKWQAVAGVDAFEKSWEGKREEVISRKYLDPNLTGNLGPRVSGGWGENVSHPKVPLAADEAEQAAAAPAPVAAPVAEAPAGADAPGVFQMRRPAEQKPAGPAPGSAGGAAAKEPDAIAYRLARVFDYTVEPNKKYIYRVKLGLMNPSHQLPAQYLAQPETSSVPFLAGEWSAPTAPVIVPSGYGVLAGMVKPASGSKEPSVKLRVTMIDLKEGLPAATELAEAYRGTLANALKQTVPVKDPRGGPPKDVTLNFESNILVLDIYGGTKISMRIKEMFAPGEVLVLDAQGNMSVRNELDDSSEFEASMVKPEPPPKKVSKDKDNKLEDDGKKKKARDPKERAARRENQ